MIEILNSSALTFAIIGSFICWITLHKAKNLKMVTFLVCCFIASWLLLSYFKIFPDGMYLLVLNIIIFTIIIMYIWRWVCKNV